jgi:CheY-like chemotaxis protein
MNAEKSKTILLVEDESLIAMDEQASLRQYGYGVSIARTGEEAIEAFDTPERYDMVLMDIDLGEGIDGTEAASEILKKKDLPIVFGASDFCVGRVIKAREYGILHICRTRNSTRSYSG